MASLLNFLGIDSRRSSVTLVEYKYDPEAREKVSKYLVRHTSSFRGTTLEQRHRRARPLWRIQTCSRAGRFPQWYE